MKKLLLAVSTLLMVVVLCSCGSSGDIFSKPTPTPIPEIDPTALITPEDVYAATGYAYAPVLDGNTYTRDGNTATAVYRSEPVGQGDPVIVEVTQYTDTVSKETVWYEYDSERAKRPSAQMVTELGEDAYLAFPSIHIFDRGCHIKITAGSGSGEEQQNMLVNLAVTAVERFEAIMPAQ